uniref:Metastasis-associated protein MTA3-like n=1 Tax=Cyanistes caeruleus TaxID=156563 RepID=A0A8C0UHW2_CYACU
MHTPHTSRPSILCIVTSPPPLLSPLTPQMVHCLHLLCIIHLFCSYCCYHIRFIMFNAVFIIIFYWFYYFTLSLCVLFIINLFFTHIFQTPTQHSSDGCSLLLLSTILEVMSTGASVLTSLSLIQKKPSFIAVGTFARALDCSSSVRQPSLHMSAAAASRDITLFHAMDTLHKHNYDLSSAISVLVPLGGPVLCRDEMEEWSASEASLFEEALEKYGKDFNDIRQDFLPWKSLTSIIEYYYMWKTTDRYVQQKRLKAAEAESKLKQVYIPTYNKPNPNQISSNNGKPAAVNGAMGASYQAQATVIGRACESCYTPQSHQWYSWGPPNMQCRLCASCWIYWKKYGGLKMPTQTDDDKLSSSQPTEESHVRTHLSRQATQGTPVRNTGSPKSAVKTRQAFFLHTTCWTKLARQVCKNTLRLRQAARRPFVPINCAAIKAEYADRHCELAGNPLKIKSTRKPLSCIIGYLEIHPAVKPNVIRSTPSLQSPSAKRLLAPSNHSSLSILGKRNYKTFFNFLNCKTFCEYLR